jgi:hypothetical protein
VIRPERAVELEPITVKAGQTVILDASKSTVVGHPIRVGDRCDLDEVYHVPDRVWPSKAIGRGEKTSNGPRSIAGFVWKQLAGEAVSLRDASKPVNQSIQQDCKLRNEYLKGPDQLRWPIKNEAVAFTAPKASQTLKFEVTLARTPSQHEKKRDTADEIAYPELTQKAIVVIDVQEAKADPVPEKLSPWIRKPKTETAPAKRCLQPDVFFEKGKWACTADQLGYFGGPNPPTRHLYVPRESYRTYVANPNLLGADMKSGINPTGIQLLHDVIGVGQATAIFVGEPARGPYRAAVFGNSLRKGQLIGGHLGFVGMEQGVSEVQIHDRVGKLVDVRRVTTSATPVVPPVLRLAEAVADGVSTGIVVSSSSTDPFKVAVFGKNNSPFSLKVLDGPIEVVDQPWPDTFSLRARGAGMATVNVLDNDMRVIATEKIVILPPAPWTVDPKLKPFQLSSLPSGSLDPDHHGGYPLEMYLPPPQNALVRVDKNVLMLGDSSSIKGDAKIATGVVNQTPGFGSLSSGASEFRLTASTQQTGSPVGWITTSAKPVKIDYPVLGNIMVSATPRLGFYRVPPGVALFRSTVTANSGFHGADVVSVIGHEGPYSLRSSNSKISVDPYTNGFNFYLLAAPGGEKEKTTITVSNRAGVNLADVVLGLGAPMAPMYIGNSAGSNGK